MVLTDIDSTYLLFKASLIKLYQHLKYHLSNKYASSS